MARWLFSFIAVGHGLADRPAEPFEVAPFITFVPERENAEGRVNIRVKTSDAVARLLKERALFQDEVLTKVKSDATDDYWRKRLSEAPMNSAFLSSVTKDFLEARFGRESEFALSSADVGDAASLTVHAFFMGVVNGIVIQKSLNVFGLGQLSYEGKPEEFAFVPDSRILTGLELHELRRRPLPELARTSIREIGPLENEANANDAGALEQVDRYLRDRMFRLHDTMLIRSIELLRSALKRRAS